MSKRTKTSVKRACDVLWANLVKIRAKGFCERCGLSGRLEAHHAHSRRDLRLRWLIANGCAYCHACHRWAEGYPLEFADWFREYRAADDKFLEEEKAKGPIAPRTLNDYLDLEAELKSQIDEVTGLAA